MFYLCRRHILVFFIKSLSSSKRSISLLGQLTKYEQCCSVDYVLSATMQIERIFKISMAVFSVFLYCWVTMQLNNTQNFFLHLHGVSGSANVPYYCIMLGLHRLSCLQMLTIFVCVSLCLMQSLV